MGCPLPFAAQAALVREQLEHAIGVAAAWGLRVGLLEVHVLPSFKLVLMLIDRHRSGPL